MWRQWRWAVFCSFCWLGFVGVSAVLTRVAAMSAAGAALTLAVALDTVSINTEIQKLVLRLTLFGKSEWDCVLLLQYMRQVRV